MPYNLGSQKHVFMNYDLVEPGYGVAWHGDAPSSRETPYGIQLAVHLPRLDLTPIIRADREWESFINVYSTVFEDDGLFRLYYECHHIPGGDKVDDLKAMIAYAESTDGVNWRKPGIGSMAFAGSDDNNLVYGLDLALGRGAHGATVFKDPGAPVAERYKLIHMGRHNGVPGVFGAVSADGLRWKALEKPLVNNFMSDTQTVARFDPQKGKYVGYFRGWRGYEAGNWHGRRAISYAETEDFRSWPVPEIIVEPDSNDPPEVDIYTNGYTPWPGAANAHLMFPTFYRRTRDTTEIHFCTSRDGLHWHRPSRQAIISSGGPGSGWEGGIYAGCGLVGLKHGEISLLVGPKWHTHNELHYEQRRSVEPPDRGYLSLATWREDGFMSLEAESVGAFTTVPLVFTGSQLHLNAWTRFGGAIYVEIVDPDTDIYAARPPVKAGSYLESNPDALAGYTFQDCAPLTGDNPNGIVSWGGSTDLSHLAGKAVRFRFWMARARLYSLRSI